ncbi:MAG: alkaline phosphatase family protein [Rikenellaceae bacterium]
MIKKIALNILASLIVVSSFAQQIEIKQPRLVVNIVVSGMRSTDIERYLNNYSLNGLRMLYEQGLHYSNCQYSYQQTTKHISLSTLSTGAQPSTHGIVGDSWFDYVTNEELNLVTNKDIRNLEYTPPTGGYSSHNLLVPTLSDQLIADSPQSKAVTVALNPTSAILINGKSGLPFWFDETTCKWTSSESYIKELPTWVSYYNQTEADIDKVKSDWNLTLMPDLYLNSRYSSTPKVGTFHKAVEIERKEEFRVRYAKYYQQISQSPIGNDIVAAFAKLAIASLKLGADEQTDLLNICFDVSRNIVEKYGPESIEAEDMYYKIDKSIAGIIRFLNSEVGDSGEVIYIVTSDSGTSPTVPQDGYRFNSRQLEVILNGFLSARHGNEKWVLGCHNGSIYLNHNVIYQKGMSLAEIQNEAATFTLQLQGVSHAMTSTALSSSYYGSGYAQKIQTGFYPRRSGDVVLNLMPNWIFTDSERLSMSGSMYKYDREVPLIIYTGNTPAKTFTGHVDPISIAPTIAEMMGISAPAASEGESLKEFIFTK